MKGERRGTFSPAGQPIGEIGHNKGIVMSFALAMYYAVCKEYLLWAAPYSQ